jgi:phosphohistidine phosphatase SixA/8-oxo-dGTP pyrophosphatase MutT (NUDIX family)
MTIYAAGCVLWREVKGQLLVALVHRGRYDDYGWAKGKLDPGEVLPQTAVREIEEETGLKVSLGVSLGVQRYNVPSGEPKEVHYWAARVSDKALAKSKFKPHEEVAEVLWMTPEDAEQRLSYKDDIGFLRALVEFYRRGELRTKPFILLRHAKATPRTDWTGPDGKRPLLPLGKQQAKSVVPVLAAFGIKRVVTSPWVRCLTTVQPYAEARKLPIIERIALSEHGNANGPARTAKVVHQLIESDTAAVLCSHRPSLPTILSALADYGTHAQIDRLLLGRTLKPGHLLVAHLTVAKKGEKRRIVSIEEYAPFIDE